MPPALAPDDPRRRFGGERLSVGGTASRRTRRHPRARNRRHPHAARAEQGAARELGAPTLVVRQFGHTACSGRDYPAPTCVTRGVDAALLGLRLPCDGTVCPGDPALGLVG